MVFYLEFSVMGHHRANVHSCASSKDARAIFFTRQTQDYVAYVSRQNLLQYAWYVVNSENRPQSCTVRHC